MVAKRHEPVIPTMRLCRGKQKGCDDDSGSAQRLGAFAGCRPSDDRQRHAGHADRHPRRDREFLHARNVHRRLGLLRGLSRRQPHGAGDDPARGPCAGLRRARLAHLGGDDPLSHLRRSDRLDLGPRHHRVLLLGGLCHRRKLAQQCGHQREPGPGAVALHDRADGGHRACAMAAAGGGPFGLRSFRDPVDPGVDRGHADPVVD